MVTTFAHIVRSRDKGTIKGGKSFFWKWVGQGQFSLSFFFVSIFSFFFQDNSERNFFKSENSIKQELRDFSFFFMLIIFNSTFEHYYFFFFFQKSRKIWIKNVNFRHGRDMGFKSGGFKNKIRKTESSGR